MAKEVSNDIILAIPGWTQEGDVLFKGYMIYEGDKYTEEMACEQFSSVNGSDALSKIISKCYGNFSVIIDTGEKILVTTSYPGHQPLFYSCAKSSPAIISDDFSLMLSGFSRELFDPTTGLEFLLAGYVPRTDTLHPKINKVKPGNIVSISRSERNVITTKDSLKFGEEVGRSPQNHLEKLQGVIKNVCKRVDKIKEDRPIILNLSAGLDSRMLAYCLYEYGFENVYTVFHQPPPGYDDKASISKNTAEELNYEWTEITRDHTDFRDYYTANFWGEVTNFIGGHKSGGPELLYGTNLEKIANHPDLPDNGVVMLGMTPAEAGKRVPKNWYSKKSISPEDLLDNIIDKYYTNTQLKRVPDDVTREVLKSRLRSENASFLDSYSSEEAIRSNDYWYCRERVPNFLISHNIIYEQSQYEVWHPFLDKEFVRFHFSLPAQQKRNRSIYRDYLSAVAHGTIDRSNDHDSINQRIYNSVKMSLSGTPFYPLAQSLKGQVDKIRDYQKDSSEYDDRIKAGVITRDKYDEEYGGKAYYKYILAREHIYRYTNEQNQRNNSSFNKVLDYYTNGK